MKYRIRVVATSATCWGIVDADTEVEARQKFDANEWEPTNSWDLAPPKIAEIEAMRFPPVKGAMRFPPVEGESWIVEMESNDYYGPFSSEAEAQEFAEDTGSDDCVVIRVLPPRILSDQWKEAEGDKP